MQTRWESSRRPLFIKTVWADGYHHPVLFNGDSTINEFKSTCKERRTKSAVVQHDLNFTSPRDDISAESNSENKCLKISTIRLLLAGIRSFKEAKHCHSPSSHTLDDSYTIDVSPKQCIKLKNLNNEVSFNPPKQASKRNKFYSKSCSLDVNDNQQSDYHKMHSKEQCRCNLSEEAINNTLSERVMVWLDLAAQNSDEKQPNHKSNNNAKNKKRGITAHVCTDIHKRMSNKSKADKSVTKRISFDESQTFNTYKTMVNTDHSILKGVKLDGQAQSRVKPNCEKIDDVSSLISSKDEGNVDRVQITRDTKKRIHIFMPDIPKKFDCDSSLSCKSSSLVRRPVR